VLLLWLQSLETLLPRHKSLYFLIQWLWVCIPRASLNAGPVNKPPKNSLSAEVLQKLYVTRLL